MTTWRPLTTRGGASSFCQTPTASWLRALELGPAHLEVLATLSCLPYYDAAGGWGGSIRQLTAAVSEATGRQKNRKRIARVLLDLEAAGVVWTRTDGRGTSFGVVLRAPGVGTPGTRGGYRAYPQAGTERTHKRVQSVPTLDNREQTTLTENGKAPPPSEGGAFPAKPKRDKRRKTAQPDELPRPERDRWGGLEDVPRRALADYLASAPAEVVERYRELCEQGGPEPLDGDELEAAKRRAKGEREQ